MADYLPRASELNLVFCEACTLACNSHDTYCPRCHFRLHTRKPDSMMRAWAFLIAGLVLYFPANMLPVMYSEAGGIGHESTILQGIIEFWDQEAYSIAIIIFIASVAVPCLKILILAMLLFTTKNRSAWALRQRTKLFRLVELIGYWSMLDVLVVAVVCSIVHFGNLTYAEPRSGIIYFGVVVILTMLSAMSFDPRLMWDNMQPVKTHD